MGFFTVKSTCDVCGEICGLNRFRTSNKGWCCPKCFKKAGFSAMTPIRTMTPETIKSIIQKREADKESLQAFQITREVSRWLKIDENNHQWYIPDGFAGKTKKPSIHKFDDIIGYELLEDGEAITKGGIGRALAGGLVFGGVGAIVGGSTGKKKTKNTCTTLKIKITLNDLTKPVEYINLITTETPKNGFLYKTCETQAQEILSLLQIICEANKKSESTKNLTIESSINTADEILKFKQLLDSGAITQEEYEIQKKHLLEL